MRIFNINNNKKGVIFINKYNDLELTTLCCLLIKPELMQKTKLKDKHFKKYNRVWKFMSAFYEKFKTFDINIMYSICKDKYQLIEYITMIADTEPSASLFELYEKQLINLYNEEEKNKWIIEKVFSLSNNLYVRNITPQEFKKQCDEIYLQADKVFEHKNTISNDNQTNIYNFIEE